MRERERERERMREREGVRDRKSLEEVREKRTSKIGILFLCMLLERIRELL
jgi:hypothetical protein